MTPSEVTPTMEPIGYKRRFIPAITKALKLKGGTGSSTDIQDQAIVHAKVTQRELAQRTPKSHESTIRSELRRCKEIMKDGGLLYTPTRGVWSLTPQGWDFDGSDASTRALVHSVDLLHGHKTSVGQLSLGDAMENKSIRCEDLEVEFVLVIPEMALNWLENHNQHNRKLTDGRPDGYAELMLNGGWEHTGEPLQFYKDGNLANGQNRLRAVVLSGVPQTFLVVRGLDERAGGVLDTGKPRIYRHVLEMRHIDDPKSFSAAAAAFWAFETSHRFQKQNYIGHTNIQIDTLMGLYPNFSLSLPYGRRCQGKLWPAVAAAMHAVFSSIDREKADTFFTQIATGQHLSAGSPTLNLREVMSGRRSRAFQMRRNDQMALIVIAWNAFYLGKKLPMTQLNKYLDTEEPIPFPTVEGLPEARYTRR